MVKWASIQIIITCATWSNRGVRRWDPRVFGEAPRMPGPRPQRIRRPRDPSGGSTPHSLLKSAALLRRTLPPFFHIAPSLRAVTLGLSLAARARCPSHRAIPFRDSTAEGGMAPICLVLIGYRASITEISLLGGIAPPLRMLCKRETLRKGRGGIAPNWPCKPHSAQ